MQHTSLTPVGDFVAKDFRTAAIFQRHRIDFCCEGRQPLEQACRKQNLPVDLLLNELEVLLATPTGSESQVAPDALPELIDLIVSTHHAYVKSLLPVILAHAEKVGKVHGERHPETVEVFRIFSVVASELESHLFKEEKILFPAIRELVRAVEAGIQPAGLRVADPISVMESEHRSAGAGFDEIRKLTSDYALPEDACTTYRVYYQELQAFEEDLHRHIHLENNILFPRAIALEAQVA